MSATSTSNITEQANKDRFYEFHCSDEAATAALVQSLARGLSEIIISQLSQNPTTANLYISLQGDLGVGKTTAVRYLLKELGYTGRVKSPTYSLCEIYILKINRHTIQFYHFDFYRMQSPYEWIDAGLQEHFASYEPSISIVEWPEKADNTLPLIDLKVEIKTSDLNEGERLVVFHANTSAGENLLKVIGSNHLASMPINRNSFQNRN